MRATLMWMSVVVVSGVRIVQCHAIIDVVIDVRVMQCHAIIDVVIGVCVMLCHQAIDNSGFSTFLNFPLLVTILNLLSCCINSSSLLPEAILCTLLHRENTSFEVCCIYIVCDSGPRSLLDYGCLLVLRSGEAQEGRCR